MLFVGIKCLFALVMMSVTCFVAASMDEKVLRLNCSKWFSTDAVAKFVPVCFLVVSECVPLFVFVKRCVKSVCDEYRYVV